MGSIRSVLGVFFSLSLFGTASLFCVSEGWVRKYEYGLYRRLLEMCAYVRLCLYAGLKRNQSKNKSFTAESTRTCECVCLCARKANGGKFMAFTSI